MALILYQLKLPPKLEFFFWQIKRRFWQLLKFGSKIKTNLHYKNDSQTTFKIQEEMPNSLVAVATDESGHYLTTGH